MLQRYKKSTGNYHACNYLWRNYAGMSGTRWNGLSTSPLLFLKLFSRLVADTTKNQYQKQLNARQTP